MKDYKSEQNPLKMLKWLKECFFGKLQGLNLQLCRKINSTTNIFQLIYLPFKSDYLSRKISKEGVWILTCNVNYVTQSVLLLIFSCCSFYVQLTNERPSTKQWWIIEIGSICFQVRLIKKKDKHRKYSVEVSNGKYNTWV